MFEDLDPEQFDIWPADPEKMEAINSILPELKVLAPDYVAFRERFGWGHIDCGLTLYEWIDDMATFLEEGMGWPKSGVNAWIIGDRDGVQYGISKIDGSLVSIEVECPTVVNQDGDFKSFIYQLLG